MRLYAANAKVKIQSTLGSPRCRTFLVIPTVLSQPKISSTRFQRVVRPSLHAAVVIRRWPALASVAISGLHDTGCAVSHR
jgi:hypothetical protein